MVACPNPENLEEFEGLPGRPALANSPAVSRDETSHSGEWTGFAEKPGAGVAVGVGLGRGAAGVVEEIGSAVVVGIRLGAAGGVDGTVADGVGVDSPTDVEAADGGSGADALLAANPAALPASPVDRTVTRIATRDFTGGLLLGGRSAGARRALHPT
jgi:hypothetical protein